MSLVNKYRRHLAFFFLINIVTQLFMPTVSFALTSGPSQPEVESFKPIDVADMVNSFTGDVSYNLPLLDVDGYPVNLSYGGGSGMDAEATCVGLGWNINAGSISRGLRGIPDDFNGDKVTKEFNTKENISCGVTLGVGGELFGLDALNANYSIGVMYNNYSGYNVTQSVGFSLSLGNHASIGLGIASSSDGLTLSPNVSLSGKMSGNASQALNGSVSLGTSFSSRTGMGELSLSVGVSTPVSEKKQTPKQKEKGNKPGSHSGSLFNNGSSISFGSPTWMPQITMPQITQSAVGSFKLGGTLFGVDVSGDISGNYSKTSLETNTITNSAYGYLNLQNGQANDRAMLDFNRMYDASFSEATTNLPIPNLTYDNFTVMGQGVGGSYRPYRSEFGYVFDARATNTSRSSNFSADAGLGNTVDGGADFKGTSVNGSSGKWVSENRALAVSQFKKANADNLYEPAYFKEQGEMNVDDDELYAVMHEEKAMRFRIEDRGTSVGLAPTLIDENSVNFSIPNNARTKRVKRNQNFSYITIAEARAYGLQKDLYNTTTNLHPLAKDHHIGEITTTKTDGTRYVYGLPIYNTNQKDVSFNINKAVADNVTANLANYNNGDNTTGNSKGTDNFYTGTTTPAYAYGYMLTAVLSSDYVDRTGNGATSDDLGSYTVFEYKPTDRVKDYNWRTPFPSTETEGRVANFDAGLYTDPDDSKASYVFGVKDIYYLSNIKTKNNIAIFKYSARNDGAGVLGENEAINKTDRFQKKLDLITMYSLPDYEANTSSAFKVKQVHFEYDYSLCPKVFNNIKTASQPLAITENGKLTLKQVYFTYGNSFKGKLSPYRFNYNTTVNAIGGGTTTVEYTPGLVDRWGTYSTPTAADLPNSIFPYTKQDKALVDSYTALWNLKSIQLPSGGLINIDIESDDYAYVQNKRAGQMFKILGAGTTNQYDSNSLTQNLLFPNGGNGKEYLFFELAKDKLGAPITNAAEYLQDVDKLYFRFLAKVNQSNVSTGFAPAGYEYVNGYAEIDKDVYGTSGSIVCPNNAAYGYIKLLRVQLDKKNNTNDENPISKAAWQFARLRTPRQAYYTPEPDSKGGEQSFMQALANASIIQNAIDFFQGPNGALKKAIDEISGSNAGLGQKFVPNKSWVRLSNPNKCKLGGGYRVKAIRMSDQWDNMITPISARPQTAEYGQKYFYDTNEDGSGFSSGVAAYEPSMGADENPFRQPIFMDEHKAQSLFSPDNGLFIEAPLGEGFFPSPTVGYSKVTVKSFNEGSTGKTVNEYFTAKDFPCIVHTLGIEGLRKKPNPILNLFSFEGYDKFTGSQGYSIEINDMHGKQKATHSYEEGKSTPKSSTVYRYKTDGQRLVNTVPAINKKGSVNYNTRVGVDYDMYADFRENQIVTEVSGVKGDLYFFFVGPLPIIMPPILPSYHRDENVLRTAVTNKVIYRYGIIDRVDNINDGNISSTENLLWDGETGEVLLTSTTTEFKDPIYAMKYPAHWSYGIAAASYNNIGYEVALPASKIDANGRVVDANAATNLHPGDELLAYNSAGKILAGASGNIAARYWVHKSGSDVSFMNDDGKVLTSSDLAGVSKFKVYRSGHDNLQTLNVGATTTFTNPIVNNPASFPVLNQNYGVLNATAIVMGDAWQTFCDCPDYMPGDLYNPYLYGVKGNLRKLKDYTYLTTRKQEKVNANSNIRVDGTFEKFTPFWKVNNGMDWTANTAGWTWVNEATLISPFGNEHENMDALLRYSSAQFGYKQTKPVAVTSNSMYKQSANENFESLENCIDDHFGFIKNNKVQFISPLKSHTGKKSIKVAPGTNVEIIKQLQACFGLVGDT